MDPEQIRERSRAAWDKAAAGWSDRREIFSEAGAPVSRKLVEMAALKPGDDVYIYTNDVVIAGKQATSQLIC